MKRNALILGHSLCKWLHRYLRSGTDPRLFPSFNIAEVCAVQIHGFGGRTVEKILRHDMSEVCIQSPDIVILLVGDNDVNADILPEVMPPKRKASEGVQRAVKCVQSTSSRMRSSSQAQRQDSRSSPGAAGLDQPTMDKITQQVIQHITPVINAQIDNKLDKILEMLQQTRPNQQPATSAQEMHQGPSTSSITQSENDVTNPPQEVAASIARAASDITGQIDTGVSCNDPPQLQQRYVFNVKEDVPIGTKIGRITAVDMDGPQELAFSSSNQMTSDIVSLTNPMGSSSVGRAVDMVLTHTLDRELRTDYDLEFDVTDGTNTVHFYVKIIIQDVNDNSPRFLSHSYSKAISPRSPVGMIVLIVVASDIDSGIGGQIQYSLEADDPNDLTYFFINTQAGLIMTKAPLISISYHEFNMRAVATDGYGLKGSVNVTITVSSYPIPTPPAIPSLITPSPPPVTGRGFVFG